MPRAVDGDRRVVDEPDVLVGVPLLLPVQEATLVGLPSRYAFDSGGRWYGRPCSSVMSVIDPVKRYCRSDAAVR